ncbi:MAG: GumC family protein [Vicinamibacterales bacterium]
MPTPYRKTTGPAAHSHVNEERHILDYVRTVYKRRWLAIPVFLLVVVIGMVNALREVPLYQATTQLLIEKDTPTVATLDQMFQAQDGWFNDAFYQTQYRILQSRSLSKRAIDELQMWNQPLGKPVEERMPLDPLTLGRVAASKAYHGALRLAGMESAPAPSRPAEPRGADESESQAAQIDQFRGGVGIEPVRNSRLVDIVYTSTDPAFAAKAANALAKAYIAQSLEFRFSESKETADWLGEQLAEQRKALEASEAALQAYREKNGAVSVTDSASNIVVQRLSDLNSALTKAKTERINKEAIYNQLKAAEAGGKLDTFPSVQANEFIQKLRGDLTDLQRQQALLSERYGERHAEMIKIRASVELAEAKLKAELGKVVESVRNEYQAALAEEQSLQGALNTQKSEALSLNRTGIEFGVLQREVESNKQLYESLMQRTKETDISSERKATNIRVVDEAQVPNGPISPNLQRSALLSLVAGLTLSLGLVFFIDYLDSRLKTPQDLKNYLGVPFLGLVPAVSRTKGATNPLLTEVDAPSFSEAFKTVRTNVLFSSAEDGLRTLVVTSAGPGEGKSICSANIAIALAQTGLRVLLVDADMRRPRVHEIFESPEEPGLSNLLTGNAKASEAIQKSKVPGLWLMPAGHIPPNPAELLSSPRFMDFLGALEDHFDWVVLDTPPVLVVADSLVVANKATGVVFVVGADQTTRNAARNAVEQLMSSSANVIGSMLNRADVHRHSHYYSTYYKKEYARYYVKQQQ